MVEGACRGVELVDGGKVQGPWIQEAGLMEYILLRIVHTAFRNRAPRPDGVHYEAVKRGVRRPRSAEGRTDRDCTFDGEIPVCMDPDSRSHWPIARRRNSLRPRGGGTRWCSSNGQRINTFRPGLVPNKFCNFF